jgi:hypothetical protein
MSAPSTGSSEAARGPRPALAAFVERAAGGPAAALAIVRLRRLSVIVWQAGSRRVVSKCARTAADDAAVWREGEVLRGLADDPRWPRLLAAETLEGRAATVITEVAGAKALLIDPVSEARLGAAATTIDAAVIALGGARPRDIRLADAMHALSGGAPDDARSDLIETAAAAWPFADAELAWPAHGDCTPANLLFDGARAGLIDWSTASPGVWAGFDRMTLAWFVWCKRDGLSYRAAADRLAAGPLDDAAGRALLSDWAALPAETRSARTRGFLAIQHARALREGARERADRLRAVCVAIGVNA